MTEKAMMYSALPYTIEVVPEVTTDGETVYVARHPELLGCMAHGDTPESAKLALKEARELYIGSMIEDGLLPPMPSAARSGYPAMVVEWVSQPVFLSSGHSQVADCGPAPQMQIYEPVIG